MANSLIPATDIHTHLRQRRVVFAQAQRLAMGYPRLLADEPTDSIAASNLIARSRGFAYSLAKGDLTEGGPLNYDDDTSGPDGEVNEREMSAAFWISSERRDRHGDVVLPAGCLETIKDYATNAQVFFAHKSEGIPIANACDPKTKELQLKVVGNRLWSKAFFNGITQESNDIFGLVCKGHLKTSSIGFLPLLGEIIQPVDDGGDDQDVVVFDAGGGIVFHKWSLLEWSIVAVPANPDALRAHLGTLAGRKLNSFVRAKLLRSVPQKKRVVLGYEPNRPLAQHLPSWHKAFDISKVKMRPASYEYDVASKHLNTPVKNIYQHSVAIPAAKIGSFLTAWRDVMSPHRLVDVRNMTYDGKEYPPNYRVIQLNSTKSDDFLVDGVSFYQGTGSCKFVTCLNPSFYGLSLTFYIAKEHKKESIEWVNRAWDLAATQYNFLKGEAFSLGGDFLPKTPEKWIDVFLKQKNEVCLKRTLKQLNDKQLGFKNRGVIFLGPPGTGKTLSGRIIRNDAKASFVWISAKDFGYMGSFGGISYAFELAKELSPCILFFEDVDNWLSKGSVDLLKTEMDGVQRYSGVWTILTTNYPERLPKALIDRPGRFHDVLAFDLPDPVTRKKMLGSWLPDLTNEKLQEIVGSTKGYSGAHLYELVQFAKSLQEEGKTLDTALTDALTKIAEQKQLIDNPIAYERDSAGRYDDREERSVTPLIKKYTARGAFKSSLTKSLTPKKKLSTMPLDDLVGGPKGQEPPYEDENDGAEGDEDSSCQAVLFNKAKFPEEADVTSWLSAHQLSTDQIYPPETEDEPWVAIQFDAEECQVDSAKREEVEEGVQAVTCTKGEDDGNEESDEEGDELPELPAGTNEPKAAGKGVQKVAQVTSKKLAPVDGPPLEEDHPEIDNEEKPTMPYGAEVVTNLHKHLCSVCQYCEDAVGLLEHPAVQKTVEKLKGVMEQHRDAVKEFGSTTYPDHFKDSVGDEDEVDEDMDSDDEDTDEMGDDSDDVEGDDDLPDEDDDTNPDSDGDSDVPDQGVGADDGPGPEEADDEGEDDEEEDDPKPPKGKKKRPKLSDEKSGKLGLRKMSQKDLSGVMEAAEFLDELSGEDNLKKSQKAASRLHASELKGLHKKHTTSSKEPTVTNDVSKAALLAFTKQMARTRKLMYSLTGEDY